MRQCTSPWPTHRQGHRGPSLALRWRKSPRQWHEDAELAWAIFPRCVS